MKNNKWNIEATGISAHMITSQATILDKNGPDLGEKETPGA